MSCENGHHEYAEHVCESCGSVYCYACGNTNADLPVKPEYVWWECPHCGHVEEPYREEYYEDVDR